MKKTKEDFYTQVHHEVLSLVVFHIRAMEQRKKTGTAEPDIQEKINLLRRYKELVYKNADNRLSHWQDQEHEKQEEMNTRLKAECPECNKVTAVTIIGEEKVEDWDYLFDTVKCNTCQSEFRNSMPNNWDDRSAYSKYCAEFFSGIKEKDKNMPAKVKEDFDALISYYNRIAASHSVVLQKKWEVENAIKNADQSLEEIRDYLMMAKINALHWNNPPAIN